MSRGPKRHQFNVRLGTAEQEQLAELAAALGLTPSEVVRSLVAQAHARVDRKKLQERLSAEAAARKRVLGGS
jgi:hypothetical protein